MSETPELTESTVIRRSLETRVRKFRGSLMIARGQQALKLDEVGEHIFRQLDGVATIRDIGERTARDYDISADEATADSQEFLAELLNAGLVEIARP